MDDISMMPEYFRLHVKLESLGAQIVKMFPADAIKGQLEDAVKRGIASFDFDKEVERQVHALLQDKVRAEVSKRIDHIAKEAAGSVVRDRIKEALRKELGHNSGRTDAWGFPIDD